MNNLMFIERSAGDVLSKEQMKHIVGGGTIHCKVNGREMECQGGTLLECTEACADAETCGGCAEFPDNELKSA